MTGRLTEALRQAAAVEARKVRADADRLLARVPVEKRALVTCRRPHVLPDGEPWPRYVCGCGDCPTVPARPWLPGGIIRSAEPIRLDDLPPSFATERVMVLPVGAEFFTPEQAVEPVRPTCICGDRGTHRPEPGIGCTRPGCLCLEPAEPELKPLRPPPNPGRVVRR